MIKETRKVNSGFKSKENEILNLDLNIIIIRRYKINEKMFHLY